MAAMDKIAQNATSPYLDSSQKLVSGTTYYYLIWARNADGGKYSEFAEGILNAPPQKPIGVDASDGDYTDRVRITWAGQSNTESFELFRSTSASGQKTSLGFTDKYYYDDFNCTPGKTYYYFVQGINATGRSPFSDGDTGYRLSVYVPRIPVYRFYSPNTKGHFFTINEGEKNDLVNKYSHIWNFEGIAYYAYGSPVSGTVPLYRFYSPNTKSHFFTRNEKEKNDLIDKYSHIWNFEGIAYYVSPSKTAATVPVYRFYSPGAKHHFFTINEQEKNDLVNKYSHIWNFEGIAFYAWQTVALGNVVLEDTAHTGSASSAPDPADMNATDGDYAAGRCLLSDNDDGNLTLTLISSSPVYRFYSPNTKGHFFTMNEKEKNDLIDKHSDIWNFEGIAFHAFKDPTTGTVPVYRFWAPGAKSHFYTINEVEKNDLIAKASHIWNFEGIAFYVMPTHTNNSVPVYRFWAPGAKHHFYTINENEKNNLVANASHIWNFEGIAFYAWSVGQIIVVNFGLEAEEGDGKVLRSPMYANAQCPAGGYESADGAAPSRNGEGIVATSGTFELVALPDKIALLGDGVADCGDFAVEVCAFTPMDGVLATDSADYAATDSIALRLILPEGSFVVPLWDEAEGAAVEEFAEGSFDFALPADGAWYLLRAEDLEGNEVYSLWLRAAMQR